MKTKSLFAMIKNRTNRENIYSKAEYWDAKAVELDGDAVSMWPNNALNQLYNAEQTALLAQTLPALKGKSVLDIGCGTGRLTRHFSSEGAFVTGIDFSKNAIDIAKNHAQHQNIEYRHESVFELSEKSKYDVIFTWGCLVMAAKDERELNEIIENTKNALKPDGILLMLEPIHKGFVHRVLNMDLDGFCGILNENNLSVSSIENMHFWPIRYILAFAPIPAVITVPLYHLGQWLMKLSAFENFGDYKAIVAKKKLSKI